MNATEHSRPRLRVSEIFEIVTVLSIGALLGLSKITYPLMDDQVEFLIGARIIAQGGVLYREFWNIKPPGIFMFYLVGGSLLGFNEIGIHAFELLYMLLFAATLIFVLRRPLELRQACLAALFTVGSYYIISDDWWLTNVEQLVNFPIFLVLMSLFYVGDADRRRPLWLMFAGLASGCVFLFKPILFLVPFSLWMLFAVLNRQLGRQIRTWALLISGALVPFAGVLCWFIKEHAALLFLKSMFVFPLEISRRTDVWSRWPILLWGIHSFTEKAAPLMFLAGVGIVFIWRANLVSLRGTVNSKSHQFLVGGLLVWLIAGCAAILTQVVSWWDNHWLLLLSPLSILSAIAVDALVRDPAMKTNARVVRCGVIVIALALSGSMGNDLFKIARTFKDWIGALDPAKRVAYQGTLDRHYEEVRLESLYLSRPDTLNGSIYVWGSPLMYLFTGREIAAAVQGSNPDLMTSELFDWQAKDLERNLPAYIFLTRKEIEPVVLAVPRLRAVLGKYYEVEREGYLGTWYRRKTMIGKTVYRIKNDHPKSGVSLDLWQRESCSTDLEFR